MNILFTRLLHWKKSWWSVLFWLLLPVGLTWMIVQSTEAIKEDSSIPISIILEDETPIAKEFKDTIANAPLVHVLEYSKEEALNELKKHELDSVFIVDADFDTYIKQNRKVTLIKGYESNFSFAYLPVKELLLSHIQKEAGRYKMAEFITEMSKHYPPHTVWKQEDMIQTAKQIEEEEHLLDSSLVFSGQQKAVKESPNLLNHWGIWAILTFLSTSFLFDFIIKEKKKPVTLRFLFTRYSFKTYLLQNFFIYSGLLFIIDIATAYWFAYMFTGESVTLQFIGLLLLYRLTINAIVFLLALLIKHVYTFYTVAFSLIILMILTSNAILPLNETLTSFAWLHQLNPVQPFLDQSYQLKWPIMLLFIMSFWYVRKED